MIAEISAKALGPSGERGDRSLAVLARSLLAERRGIEQFVDRTLFADPARDILLDLYIAAADRKPVTVSSCCIGASVPATTGLRWIRHLTAKGLIEAHDNPGDQRSRHVTLTDQGYAAMTRYLEWLRARRAG